MPPIRRTFLTQLGLVAASTVIPARWCSAEEVKPGRKLKLRFAIASDLHYGQRNTPFVKMADEMVAWMNKEKADKGLDFLVLNGDLTQDNPEFLLALRDKHLSQLKLPYYCVKGNHDYVDGLDASPTKDWEKLWGYKGNHTVVNKDFVFIMADTSAEANSRTYLAADIDWIKKELETHKKAPAIFVFIHIQQRKHKKDGWPRHGVHDASQVEQAEAVMDLLEATENVRGVFHGHNHNETGAWESGGQRYFFDSHVGGSWGAARGYRIVEVDEENRMISYQMNAEEGKVIEQHDLL